LADPSLPSTERLNPAALAAADVARLPGVPVAVVEKDLAEGGPRAVDGTMNLVHYAAWPNGRLTDGNFAGWRKQARRGSSDI